MKKFIASVLLFASAASMAQEIKPERNAQAIRVKQVITETVGEHGFPSTQVKVVATFSNSCTAPTSEELVTIVNYSKGFGELQIALGSEVDRMCPMVYMPVDVTIDLGIFTRPNDGFFSKITVNGVSARR